VTHTGKRAWLWLSAAYELTRPHPAAPTTMTRGELFDAVAYADDNGCESLTIRVDCVDPPAGCERKGDARRVSVSLEGYTD